LSRIGELFLKLRKPAASMGFGFAAAAAPRRRMLLVVRLDGNARAEEIGSLLACADVAVGVLADGDSSVDIRKAAWQCSSMPLGLWVQPDIPLPEAVQDGGCDFFVCTVEGPLQVLARKGMGCLVRIHPGVESSHLRATAELGIDAVVLDAESLDLNRLSSAVECRRVHIVSGKPVVLWVRGALDAVAIGVLWRAGVDALLVDGAVGAEVLASIRAAMDTAPYEARTPSGGAAVVIGAHIGALGLAEVHEDENGGEEEDDDDDD
jgi:hypothetical protein